MAIRRGIDNAVADAEANGGGSGRRASYWSIKEDESEILRFLDDAPDWYVLRMHRFFPTKKAPADFKAGEGKKWPESMTAACRKDKAFAEEYDSCPLCEKGKSMEPDQYGNSRSKTASLVYALAVRREKIVCDGSAAMGGAANKGKKAIVDRMVELDELGSDGKPTGNKKSVPDIRIVSNTMFSLFGGLKSAFETFDSITDRDFQIKREKAPNGKGTVHTSVGLDKIDALQPGKPRWKTYEEALEFYALDLGDMLEHQASDEFYNRWFLDTPTDSQTSDTSSEEESVLADRLKDVQGRLSETFDFA